MKKYDDKLNVIGILLKKHREQMKLSKEEVCRRIQLHGIYIDRTELYRMETGEHTIRDFEMIALCDVLEIDYNTEVRKLIE